MDASQILILKVLDRDQIELPNYFVHNGTKLYYYLFIYSNKNTIMDKILKQFGIDKLTEAAKTSNSFTEATSFLGLDTKNVNIKKNVERSIKRLGLSTEHFESVQKLKTAKTRYTKEKLELIVKTCKNYKEILIELDVLPIDNNYKKLKGALYRFNIDCSHLKGQRISTVKVSWTKEVLEPIFKKSLSQKEVLENLGLRSAGGNFGTLQKYIKLYDLDSSHFIKSYEVMRELNFKNKISLDDILVEHSTYDRNHLKNRLYDAGLKTRKCELCEQGEEWNGRHMSLILDHQNGVHDDNRFENLRIVCPNCNATLDTHAGKNIKKKIKPETLKTLSKLDVSISRRKVERPSFDALKSEINLLGFEATGRKYNVSGNAIKKWLRTYEKYGK